MTARPRPTLANWSQTCDWGHCNGQSYAVRWADDLGLWLPVCRKHRARDVVSFEDLDDEVIDAQEAAADAAEAQP